MVSNAAREVVFVWKSNPPQYNDFFFVILSHQVGLMRNQFILAQMQMLTCTSTAVYTRCCCYSSLLLGCLAFAPVRAGPYMLGGLLPVHRKTNSSRPLSCSA